PPAPSTAPPTRSPPTRPATPLLPKISRRPFMRPSASLPTQPSAIRSIARSSSAAARRSGRWWDETKSADAKPGPDQRVDLRRGPVECPGGVPEHAAIGGHQDGRRERLNAEGCPYRAG